MKLWKLTALGAIAMLGVVGCSNDHIIRTEDGQIQCCSRLAALRQRLAVSFFTKPSYALAVMN